MPGSMADTVAARSGSLTLQSQPTATPGQPALVIGGDPPVLKFGLYQGGTDVNALLTVTAQGDVTATGTIKGALTAGEIRVQSGTHHRRPHHPAASGDHPGPGRPAAR